MAFHQHMEHKYVDTLLRSIKKTTCQGSECLRNRNRDGFFKPGNTPWIGHPTSIKVKRLFRVLTHSTNGLSDLGWTIYYGS